MDGCSGCYHTYGYLGGAACPFPACAAAAATMADVDELEDNSLEVGST